MKTIVLVACSKKKLNYLEQAKNLYQGHLFKLARRYAEQVGDEWYILSAKWGLVHPDQILEPYNVTLSDYPPLRRALWGFMVRSQLKFHAPVPFSNRLIVLAGKQYRVQILLPLDYHVEVPLDGLGIGQQMSWLKEQLDNRSEV